MAGVGPSPPKHRGPDPVPKPYVLVRGARILYRSQDSLQACNQPIGFHAIFVLQSCQFSGPISGSGTAAATALGPLAGWRRSGLLDNCLGWVAPRDINIDWVRQ